MGSLNPVHRVSASRRPHATLGYVRERRRQRDPPGHARRVGASQEALEEPSPGSSARTPPRRAASDCAPDSDSEDEPALKPARVAMGVSPYYTDADGRRIYPEPYQGHPSPAGSSMSATTTTGGIRRPMSRTPATMRTRMRTR